MGDRGNEGDPGYLAHLGPAARPDRRDERWESGRSVIADTGGFDAGSLDGGRLDAGRFDTTGRTAAADGAAADGAAADGAAAGVARRLQARLDAHLALLDRLRSGELLPGGADVAELHDAARRMRRDTEVLLLLDGRDPGAPPLGQRELADLVADAAAAALEPRRVEVRDAPAARITAGAAVEVEHLLAELVDHAAAVHPGARIALVPRLEPGAGGGALVEVHVDGAVRHDPDALGARRAAATADELARRSRHGIVLRRPADAPFGGFGRVASVHCPPAAVTVPEPPAPRRPQPSAPAPFAAEPLGLPEPAPRPTPREPTLPARINGSDIPSYGLDGPIGATRGTNGSATPDPRPSPSFDDAPAYSPSSSSRVDELFGPLLDLPLEPIDDRYATPIFEAIASAWFREGEPGDESGGADWETPQDDEWREAAARAARSEPAPTTSTGLPRRRPGDQLVPPPRRTEPGAGRNGVRNGAPAGAGPSTERVPDRVRDRLSTYQRGLREGRHRAVGAEGPEPDEW